MKKLVFILTSLALSACVYDPVAQYRQQQIQARIAAAKPPATQTYGAPTGNAAATQIYPGRQFSLPKQPTAVSKPVPKPAYAGPHNYSVVRDGMYGYPSEKTGEVHFFRYDGFHDGHYTLISFEDSTATMVVCEGACETVRVMAYDFDRTYQVKDGSVLAYVVQDMLRGALTSSR